MSQLYTVTLKAKRIISVYGAGGVKVSAREETVEQVYHDLPSKTALSYREKFPDADVVITEQAMAVHRGNSVRVSGDRESARPTYTGGIPGNATKKVRSKHHEPQIEKPSLVPQDYSELVNRMTREGV